MFNFFKIERKTSAAPAVFFYLAPMAVTVIAQHRLVRLPVALSCSPNCSLLHHYDAPFLFLVKKTKKTKNDYKRTSQNRKITTDPDNKTFSIFLVATYALLCRVLKQCHKWREEKHFHQHLPTHTSQLTSSKGLKFRYYKSKWVRLTLKARARWNVSQIHDLYFFWERAQRKGLKKKGEGIGIFFTSGASG